MTKEEQNEIPGYRIYENDGTRNVKVTEIAVRSSTEVTSVKVIRYDKVSQILWILLNNQKQKIRIEANYGLQEDMTPNNELILLYKAITEYSEKAKFFL